MTRSAGKNTLTVMALVLLSRVLGVVRDMVINQVFGQNQITDIYTAAFRIPDILQYLVAGGALATVFVPVFTEYWTTGKQRDAWKVFGTVMSIVACVALALVVVMEVLAAPLARFMNPGIGLPHQIKVSFWDAWRVLLHPENAPPSQQAAWTEIARLSRILLPAQWFFFAGGLMMGTLNARKRFLIPNLGPIAYNGMIILGGLTQVFVAPKLRSIDAMCWGALIGAILGPFLLQLWELKRSGAKFQFNFDTSHPGVRKVGKLMLPALLGLSLSQLGFWITGSFASGEGTLSALRNAYNLTQAPIGIFAQASAMVIFPTIAALAASGNMKEFRKEIHFGIRQILFLTLPASLLMAVLAEPIIAAIYFKGRFMEDAGGVFTTTNLLASATALRMYSLGTFAWSAQAVLARGFYAKQNSKTPVIITTSMVFLFTALCAVLPGIGGLGFRGLALALSIAGTLNMVIFYYTLQTYVGGLNLKGLLRAALKITISALLASGVAGLFLRLFWHLPTEATKDSARFHGMGVFLLASVAALAVYVVACTLLRVPELGKVRDMFRRKSATSDVVVEETHSQTPQE
jgi:putative peptidoglycan lipid II flippase